MDENEIKNEVMRIIYLCRNNNARRIVPQSINPAGYSFVELDDVSLQSIAMFCYIDDRVDIHYKGLLRHAQLRPDFTMKEVFQAWTATLLQNMDLTAQDQRQLFLSFGTEQNIARIPMLPKYSTVNIDTQVRQLAAQGKRYSRLPEFGWPASPSRYMVRRWMRTPQQLEEKEQEPLYVPTAAPAKHKVPSYSIHTITLQVDVPLTLLDETIVHDGGRTTVVKAICTAYAWCKIGYKQKDRMIKADDRMRTSTAWMKVLDSSTSEAASMDAFVMENAREKGVFLSAWEWMTTNDRAFRCERRQVGGSPLQGPQTVETNIEPSTLIINVVQHAMKWREAIPEALGLKVESGNIRGLSFDTIPLLFTIAFNNQTNVAATEQFIPTGTMQVPIWKSGDTPLLVTINITFLYGLYMIRSQGNNIFGFMLVNPVCPQKDEEMLNCITFSTNSRWHAQTLTKAFVEDQMSKQKFLPLLIGFRTG